MEIAGNVADLDRWRLVGFLGVYPCHDEDGQNEDDEQRSGFHDGAPFRDMVGRHASTLMILIVIDDIRMAALGV
jgi:hypothetical protein